MNSDIFKALQETDLVNIDVKEMKAIPAGSNPFDYDSARSGISLPSGWTLMYEMSRRTAMKELVLVNHFTGQRLQLNFTAKHPQLKDLVESDKHRNVREISGRMYIPEFHDSDTLLWRCVDDRDVSGMLDYLYTLWWSARGGLIYVRAKLFIDEELFKAAMAELTDDPFDPGRNYHYEAAYVKEVFAKYGPGPAPATAKNVTAKPFGLNE